MTIRMRRLLLTAWFALAAGLWPTLALFVGYHPFDLDFAVYWAAALALRAKGVAAIYDGTSVAASFHAFHAASYLSSPADYPPQFFLAFAPLTLLPPVVGFVLWTMINLAAAAWVLRALAMRAGDGTWVWPTALLLFFPLMFGFYLGQPTGLLLYSFYRAYCALEMGRDVRAGLWLGGLLIKPQYAIVLVLVLLGKRRYCAVAGLAMVAVAGGVSSLWLLGISGVRAYLALLIAIRTIDSQIMISWHGLLAALDLHLAAAPSAAITVVLSVLSVAALIPIWRGPWQPRGERFAGQMLATMVVTLLVGYHIHIHGAVLLLVPGAILAGTKSRAMPFASLLRLAFFLPGVVLLVTLALTNSLTGEAVVIALLQVAILAMLVHAELRRSWEPRRQPPVLRLDGMEVSQGQGS